MSPLKKLTAKNTALPYPPIKGPREFCLLRLVAF